MFILTRKSSAVAVIADRTANEWNDVRYN